MMYRNADNCYTDVLPVSLYRVDEIREDGCYSTFFPGFVRALEYARWQDSAEDRRAVLVRLLVAERSISKCRYCGIAHARECIL